MHLPRRIRGRQTRGLLGTPPGTRGETCWWRRQCPGEPSRSWPGSPGEVPSAPAAPRPVWAALTGPRVSHCFISFSYCLCSRHPKVLRPHLSSVISDSRDHGFSLTFPPHLGTLVPILTRSRTFFRQGAARLPWGWLSWTSPRALFSTQARSWFRWGVCICAWACTRTWVCTGVRCVCACDVRRAHTCGVCTRVARTCGVCACVACGTRACSVGTCVLAREPVGT